RRDGRILIATTVTGGDCSSVYELADSAVLLLGSDDRDDRMWAIQRLASQPDPRAVDNLSMIARGGDGPLALAAVRALGTSGTTLAVGELVRVAGHTGDGERRQLAGDLALEAEP